MCGIVGFLDKRGGNDRPLGRTLLALLEALGCRGPDSAGVALLGPPQPGWLLQVKVPDHMAAQEAAAQVSNALREGSVTPSVRPHRAGAYLRVEIQSALPVAELEERLLRRVPGTEVVSLGRRLEILKQVGSPAQLNQTYAIAERTGSHGIGHTRLSTESRVDLSHSQPFWAHGVPDLATVHNGHITNYHKLRRKYEQCGYRFFTENDSEVIGIYLRDRLAAGLSLMDALRSSLDDFDGSFSYLAASGDLLAFVKDRFGFKPLMLAETDDFVAIATEEIALRQALGHDFVAREPAPGTIMVWSVKEGRTVSVA
jgi:glutamate synthase domain-containing protein 1